MAIDRLEEFRSSSGHAPKQKQADSPPSADKTFFAVVAEINRLVKHAEACTKRSEVLHKHAVVAVGGVETINAEIESEKESFKVSVGEAREMIEALEHPSERLLKSQKLALNRKLLKVIEAFEQMQRTSRARYRTCLERQYLILKPTADASELAIISQVSLDTAPQSLFAVANAEGKLAEMKSRQTDLKKLERDLMELHELVLKIQQVVQEQGEKVQSLDEYVSGIEEQTSKAAEVITKSVVGRRVLQKRKWIMILIVLVVLLVTGLILYISWKVDQKPEPKPVIVQVPQPAPPQPPQKKAKEVAATRGEPSSNDAEDQAQQSGEEESVPQGSSWPIPEVGEPEDTGEAPPTEADEGAAGNEEGGEPE